MDFRLAKEEDRDLVESLWAYCFEPREHPFFSGIFEVLSAGKRAHGI